jgi:hypothetical protein
MGITESPADHITVRKPHSARITLRTCEVCDAGPVQRLPLPSISLNK